MRHSPFPPVFLPPLFFFSPQRSSEFFYFPFPFFLGEILVCDARSQPPRTEKGQGYYYCTHSSLSLPLPSSFLFSSLLLSPLPSLCRECGFSHLWDEQRGGGGQKEKREEREIKIKQEKERASFRDVAFFVRERVSHFSRRAGKQVLSVISPLCFLLPVDVGAERAGQKKCWRVGVTGDLCR